MVSDHSWPVDPTPASSPRYGIWPGAKRQSGCAENAAAAAAAAIALFRSVGSIVISGGMWER